MPGTFQNRFYVPGAPPAEGLREFRDWVIAELNKVSQSTEKLGLKMSGWQDYTTSGFASRAGASPPTMKVFRGDIYAWAFAGTGVTINELYCSVHITHEFEFGTKLYPHVHWSHLIASPTGNVTWNIDWTIARGHGQGGFAAPQTITLTQAAQAPVSGNPPHQIVETLDAAAISGTEFEVDALILFRVYRNPAAATDTFANDAFMLNFDVHYKSDGFLTTVKAPTWEKLYGDVQRKG